MTQALAHRWRFFRAGGFDQVQLETPADLDSLRGLDQKLWASLACPVNNLELDRRMLDYIDLNKDGRIRAPEILDVVDWTLQGLLLRAESGDGLGTVKQLAKLVMPVLDNLDAETRLSDVRYDTGKLRSTLNNDGSFNVNLPSSIGELRFDNIRVKGAPAGQSFGNLSLHNIDLSQASLKVSLRP